MVGSFGTVRSAVLAALFFVGAGSGCVCTGGGVDEAPDARFVFTFGGVEDCLTAGVGVVRLTYENSALAPVDVICPQNGGGLEVRVDDLPADEYVILFQAFDVVSPNFVAFSARQSIDHREGATRRYDVDLAVTTQVATYFTFAANAQSANGMTCFEAGVQTVKLRWTRTGAQPVDYDVPCHDAATSSDAASLEGLDAGTYTVSVQAFDPAGVERYASDFFGVVVMGAAANDIVLNILPLATSVQLVEFEFKLPGDGTCAQFAVTYNNFTLENASGQQVAANPYTVNCDPVGGRLLKARFEGTSQLAPGRYTLASAAYSANNVLRAQATNVLVYVPAGRDIGWPIQLQNP